MATSVKKSTHCQWCSAVNCSNSRNNRPDLAFFRFPKDQERSKRWVINCRRADLDGKPAGALHRGNVLCEEHFESSWFGKSAVRKRLLSQAVPTIFSIPNPPPKTALSRLPPRERFSTPVIEIFPGSASNDHPIPEYTKITASNDEHRSTLKRKLNAERSKTWRLKKKLKLSTAVESKELDTSVQKDIDDVNKLKDLLSEYLSGPAVQFVLTQFRVSKLSSRQRRWNNKDKSLALSIFHASRKAYKLLQKIFNLPSPRTLSLAMQNLHINPGESKNLLDMFHIKVNAMAPNEKLCAIIFDEMSLKAALRYDPQNDIVEGFEDFGTLGRSKYPANHALVFMVRGLVMKWKQPLSYVLSSGPVKATLLLPLLQQVIHCIINLGLVPKIVICDQGSNNRSVFSSLGISSTHPFFTCDGHKVFAMYDPPHLIKNIRNNLKLHGFDIGGITVSWTSVVKFYELDSQLPIRMAPKLTRKHIELPAFARLRVSLAVQVLSHTVAAGISTMVTLGALPPEAMTTANFIERFDRLFNCFNSHSLRSKNVMGHAITASSNHVDFLQETLNWLSSLKVNNSSGTLPCLEGWKLTINCLILLWEDLQSTHQLKFFLTDRLNQDCLENLFSVIRGKGGHRFNPDAAEFKSALRQSMIDSVLVTSDRQNCKDDVDSLLFSLDHVISQGANSAIKSRLHVGLPRQIQNLMVVPATPSLSVAEENIVVYIAGYIVAKLSPVLCKTCTDLIKGQRDSTNSQHAFLCAKNFNNCAGGLQTPSSEMTSVCQILETTFRDVVPMAIHVAGLRNMAVRKLMEACYGHQLICTSEKKCDLHFYIVSLFANIRLHHLIKCISLEAGRSKGKKNVRKAVTFKHL